MLPSCETWNLNQHGGAIVYYERALAAKTMDEHQPTFKVTDRRLFNADGSPRDVPPEEKPATTAVSGDPVSSPPRETSSEPKTNSAPTPIEPSDESDEELSEEELADAQDPASFVNFLMSIASNAASALGIMEHPVTHQREVDIELGKHWIDVIGMLEKKTKGNLTAQEKQMLEGLLRDLRMQYVSLVNAPQKARTFSSKDITGGR
jgi:Domain of unknown function (DUF1844)